MYVKKYNMFTREGDIKVALIVAKALRCGYNYQWVFNKLIKLAEQKDYEEATDTHVLDRVWERMEGDVHVF